MCVCVLPRNLGDSFASLLVEPIAGKSVSPSDKKIVAIFEEKLQRNRSVKPCRSVAILKFFALADVSRKRQNAN